MPDPVAPAAVTANALQPVAGLEAGSVVGLIGQLHAVELVVVVLLLAASVVAWAIIVEKVIQIGRLHRSADRFEDIFWQSDNFETLFQRMPKRPKDPMAATFAAAMREWRYAVERGLTAPHLRPGLISRIERAMNVEADRRIGQVERAMTFLASVGSVSPFVGLFGTVWGIMNSFSAIAASQNTNLATVAPGIAGALLATAVGLIAAIPAVLAYNKLSADIGRYADRLDSFTTEFTSMLQRILDEDRRQGPG